MYKVSFHSKCCRNWRSMEGLSTKQFWWGKWDLSRESSAERWQQLGVDISSMAPRIHGRYMEKFSLLSVEFRVLPTYLDVYMDFRRRLRRSVQSALYNNCAWIHNVTSVHFNSIYKAWIIMQWLRIEFAFFSSKSDKNKIACKMSINLTKNKDDLSAAWQSVVDDKSPVNWWVCMPIFVQFYNFSVYNLPTLLSIAFDLPFTESITFYGHKHSPVHVLDLFWKSA